MTDNAIAMADPFSYTSAAEVEGGAIIGQTLIKLAQDRNDIVLIAPDVGRGPATMPFIEAFPERYIDTGIAEANAVSIAAGLAASGMRPVVFGIGAFLAPKCLEQIRTDVALNLLPVTMISCWGGLDMGYFGASHHALEDISMLRGTPHLTIASAADDLSMQSLMQAAINDGLPTYIRGPSTFAAPVYAHAPLFTRGHMYTISEGSDILLIGAGLGTGLCAKAAQALKDNGVSAHVLDAAYLKPFDSTGICKAAEKARCVLVVEEHNSSAGLGALVAEALGRGSLARPFKVIGLPDDDLAVAVPHQLFERYGLTVENVASQAIGMLSQC